MLRDSFPAYWPHPESGFRKLWKGCIFTFDASVLLDLYEMEESARDEFFLILEKVKERIWLSNQAALEFYRGRAAIIERGRREVSSLAASASSSPNIFRPEANKKIAKILESEAEHAREFLDQDPIEARVSGLFEEKTGKPYADLAEIYREAERRYALQMPPGFKDKKKGDYHQYGDYIMWAQLIDFAKREKRDIVLVTSETKSDWWLHKDKKTTLGPSPELVQEVFDKAAVQFYLYNLKKFIEYAREYLGVKPLPALTKAAEKIHAAESELNQLPEHLRSSIDEVARLQTMEQERHGLLAEYNDLSARLRAMNAELEGGYEPEFALSFYTQKQHIEERLTRIQHDLRLLNHWIRASPAAAHPTQ